MSASFSASRSSFDIRPPCERPFHALAQLAPEAEERAADGVRLDLHLSGHLDGRDADAVVELEDVAAFFGQLLHALAERRLLLFGVPGDLFLLRQALDLLDQSDRL